MKCRIILITSFVLVLSLLLGCQSSSIHYPTGKDTVVIVGDGKFQIGKFPDSLKLEMFESSQQMVILEEKVKQYKKSGQNLYVIGEKNAYYVVDGTSNTCKIYIGSDQSDIDAVITYLKDYDEFSEKEQAMFDEMQ
ncbi:hypothetical protein PCCS19_42560 [Paenibacillus sp. CCS19]|uniref:hypothetical protein n=1 Tax=Paenibacillus sp. CCS19 TaxID=3158387 RepID=UPI0025601D1C|nr:hypothetical protein [Paenibacillus cellulosilyticus]GMK41200.1 hypothetical protein PCCS19_42560 [Paenibacillus cellulosilyticus]